MPLAGLPVGDRGGNAERLALGLSVDCEGALTVAEGHGPAVNGPGVMQVALPVKAEHVMRRRIAAVPVGPNPDGDGALLGTEVPGCRKAAIVLKDNRLAANPPGEVQTEVAEIACIASGDGGVGRPVEGGIEKKLVRTYRRCQEEGRP